MLAGYTAGVIAAPAVSDPSTVFDVALVRAEEISLGIDCTTLIHSLVFPQSVGPVLPGRVDHAINSAELEPCSTRRDSGKTGQARARESGEWHHRTAHDVNALAVRHLVPVRPVRCARRCDCHYAGWLRHHR